MRSRDNELQRLLTEAQSVTGLYDNLPEEIKRLLEEEELLDEILNMEGKKEDWIDYILLALDALGGTLGRGNKPRRLKDYERAIRGNARLWYEDKTGTYRMTDKPRRKDQPRCGARRKYDGKPCQAKALENGRCKYHGGLSTGPKTLEGVRRYHANRKLE